MKNLFILLKDILFKTKRRAAIVLVIFSAAIYSQVNSFLKPDYEVDIMTVQKTSFVEKISASGEVNAERAINLSFQSAGEITDINVFDGEHVAKGQKIATINSTVAYQAYLQADADYRARVASLDKVYDDIQGNADSETFAQRELRTAAETNKDKAYRALLIAQKGLSSTTLNAPFAGILNFTRNISIGSYASAASPSFTLVDPKTIYFQAEVGETEVSKIKLDMESQITLDAYTDELLTQKVGMIGFTDTVTSTGGTAYIVKVSLPENLNNKFRIGMNGDIDFILSRNENIQSIPFGALLEEDDGEFVWLVKADGTVHKQPVTTGLSSLDNVEILSGLEEGDQIVLRPPSTIEIGNKVTQK